MVSTSHIAVIGAGAFGGWTALHLLRLRARVTLVDAWGAGNSRSSSGGESRIIRATYGPNQPYTKMAARAMQLWKEHEKRWGEKLLQRVGVLWMAGTEDDDFERGSLPVLREHEIAHEELSVGQMARRWPQINFEGVRWGIFEPNGGFLRARYACQVVAERFVAEGGEFLEAAVLPGGLEEGCKHGLQLSNGSKLLAEGYVFACGPWLGRVFPETIGKLIRPTRQEIFFFGPPPGDEFSTAKLPVWGDHRERFMYGMPASDGRGFKVADDTRGPEFDPSSGDRAVSVEGLQRAREYLGFRFPGMKDAPLIESRVCQYEDTPDENFIIDRHPAAQNVWIVGGGSGHGFKHGPALGEMVAGCVLKDKRAESGFLLGRFRD